MSTDYAAKERAFLDSLKADTGRDLAEWMQAIGSAGLPHRNDTIDWLRQQGFPFSRASWLERIHHNGGRPIYAGADSRPPSTRRPKPSPVPASRAASAVNPQVPARPAQPSPLPAVSPAASAAAAASPVTSSPPPVSDAVGAPAPEGRTAPGSAPVPVASAALGSTEIAALLASAKAYRPLAQYLITAITRAVPGLTVRAADGLLILSAPQAFAAILPGPRDIRLGLDAGDAMLGAHMLRSRLPGAPPELVHTVVLDDARQVNAELIAVVDAARRRGAGSA